MNCRYYLLKDANRNNWDNIFFSKDATSKFILVSLKDVNSTFLHLSPAFGYRYRYKLWGNVFQKILVQFSSYHLLERYNHICRSFIFWKMVPLFLVYDLFRKIKPLNMCLYLWKILPHFFALRSFPFMKWNNRCTWRGSREESVSTLFQNNAFISAFPRAYLYV